MEGFITVTYPAALLAGFLSFLSPCVLPLIPAYFSFITGLSLDELVSDDNGALRKKVIVSTLAYVLGFSFVFVLMGAAASTIGGFVAEYSDYVRVAGGIIIIVLGVHLTGIIRIPGLDFERRFEVRKKPLHIVGVFLVGMAFGAGWSPCIGPMLGSILVIAGSQDTVASGMMLLAVYSAGLAVPFIFISVFINYLLVFVRKASRIIRYVNMASGVFLLIMGGLLLFNKMSLLAFA